ncbi:hypothetical protein YA0721_03555 [Pseudomonas carnis]|uniref:hypothetical protein n=1 Tax=Pseudomonas carnis TaxID=2487355 RepID=UPI0018E6068B|nr:hypothetical protein [Pseudomonas carnis]MBI6655013.1 hypothetical protein [Pseudomonas carnis]MBI6660125.1 hypothetical protein [Pseudomonas carnis]MBI6687130.1 hypothetical protein [Pseudomonas carnis]
MTEVKRYHVTEAGLVEGSALGRLNVVLASDYDAAVTHIRELKLLAGQEMKSTELATNAGLRACLERDALQALLTAADERADVLETEVARLNRVKLSLKELADSRADNCSVYRQHLTVALALAEKVRDASLGMQRKFMADLIDHLHQSDAALKPAEGRGDEE